MADHTQDQPLGPAKRALLRQFSQEGSGLPMLSDDEHHLLADLIKDGYLARTGRLGTLICRTEKGERVLAAIRRAE